jgi:predicted small metal-binding protein
MKRFRCGEIVPGCEWTIEGESDEQILGHVAEHAREEHGMDEVPPEVQERVRSLIVEE